MQEIDTIRQQAAAFDINHRLQFRWGTMHWQPSIAGQLQGELQVESFPVDADSVTQWQAIGETLVSSVAAQTPLLTRNAIDTVVVTLPRFTNRRDFLAFFGAVNANHNLATVFNTPGPGQMANTLTITLKK